MKTLSSNLDRLRIATPCPISWEQMAGDNRIRFCDHCRLNVYNISELSRLEAETLIASTEGRLCARLYQRADGTVITKDCPVGLRAWRKRVSKRLDPGMIGEVVLIEGPIHFETKPGTSIISSDVIKRLPIQK